ncbi:hypothetical protein AgCh_037024 [Apium graveolens]
MSKIIGIIWRQLRVSKNVFGSFKGALASSINKVAQSVYDESFRVGDVGNKGLGKLARKSGVKKGKLEDGEQILKDFVWAYKDILDKKTREGFFKGDKQAVTENLNQIHRRSLKFRGGYKMVLNGKSSVSWKQKGTILEPVKQVVKQDKTNSKSSKHAAESDLRKEFLNTLRR